MYIYTTRKSEKILHRKQSHQTQELRCSFTASPHIYPLSPLPYANLTPPLPHNLILPLHEILTSPHSHAFPLLRSCSDVFIFPLTQGLSFVWPLIAISYSSLSPSLPCTLSRSRNAFRLMFVCVCVCVCVCGFTQPTAISHRCVLVCARAYGSVLYCMRVYVCARISVYL
jgi:hypothetical protein